MRRAIRDKATGVELAAAEEPQVFEFEGNLYFDPDTVNSEALVVTTETYTCPYKGTCFWVDVKDGARGLYLEPVAAPSDTVRRPTAKPDSTPQPKPADTPVPKPAPERP